MDMEKTLKTKSFFRTLKLSLVIPYFIIGVGYYYRNTTIDSSILLPIALYSVVAVMGWVFFSNLETKMLKSLSNGETNA